MCGQRAAGPPCAAGLLPAPQTPWCVHNLQSPPRIALSHFEHVLLLEEPALPALKGTLLRRQADGCDGRVSTIGLLEGDTRKGLLVLGNLANHGTLAFLLNVLQLLAAACSFAPELAAPAP